MLQLDLLSPMTMSITNLVTAESRRLPHGGQWELVIDDDEKQASLVHPKHAVDTGDDELDFTIIDIDDILLQRVFQSANGERYVTQGNQEKPTKPVNLDNELRSFIESDLGIQVAGSNVQARLGCAILARARSCKQRAVISLNDLYTYMGLTTYKGQPSRWVGRKNESWQATINKCGLGGQHFIWSIALGGNAECKLSLPHYARCLPFNGVTLAGFLVVALAWAEGLPHEGGIRGVKAPIEALIRALIDDLQFCPAHALTIQFDNEWKCTWPRPEKVARCATGVFKIQNGRMSISQFEEAARADQSGMAARWLVLVSKGGACTGKADIHLYDMLRAARHSSLDAFVGQLVMWMSLRLEASWGEQHRAAKVSKKGEGQRPCTFLKRGWDALLNHGGLAARLVQYTQTAREESAKHSVFTISVDKGNMIKLTLANGCIVYPNNLAVVCCPSVPWLFRFLNLNVGGWGADNEHKTTP